MKTAFKFLKKAIAATIVLLGCNVLSMTAQNDPLSKHPDTKIKVSVPANLSSVLKTRISKAQAAAKASGNTSLVLGYTSALERKPSELLGVKNPGSFPSAEAMRKQEEINKPIITKANAELKANGANVPKVANVGSAPVYWNPAIYTPVKDQGGCGSCWAFAAAASFEHTFKKFYGTGRAIDVSEQCILNCSGAGSCGGGQTPGALDFLRKTGCSPESYDTYTATDKACANPYRSLWAYTWGGVSSNIETMKAYISAYGSIATYLKAGEDQFYAYHSGIITYKPSNPNDIDHAVTIVGWYEPYQSWIIKNSWGTGWGYGGYAYVRYDACNIGKWNWFVYPYNTGYRISAEPHANLSLTKSPVEGAEVSMPLLTEGHH